MAPAIISSVNPDAFSNNKCMRQTEQELTEETEKEISHLFLLKVGSHVAGLPRNSLFSQFAPVGKWLSSACSRVFRIEQEGTGAIEVSSLSISVLSVCSC
jgi:hypothetical protein